MRPLLSIHGPSSTRTAAPASTAAALLLAAGAAACLAGCAPEEKRYSTHVEIVQVRQFGRTTRLTDLELRYSDCPGNVRKIIRVGADFAACGAKLKAGDELPAEVRSTYNRERESFRSDIVRLGDCDVVTDPRDEANYEQVENCTELKVTGMVVGVHCDRTRSEELVAACPWLRRR